MLRENITISLKNTSQNLGIPSIPLSGISYTVPICPLIPNMTCQQPPWPLPVCQLWNKAAHLSLIMKKLEAISMLSSSNTGHGSTSGGPAVMSVAISRKQFNQNLTLSFKTSPIQPILCLNGLVLEGILLQKILGLPLPDQKLWHAAI